jgi:pyridoxamine 5'-phosphate oxidase
MNFFDDLRAHFRAIRTLSKGVTTGLIELSADPDPIALFSRWYDEAEESGLLSPESMSLATSTLAGTPSVRMVLLKGVDQDGFRFFTNYESRKAREIEANPQAALCFHWSVLERQVRVEGGVLRLPKEESEAYFGTRSRGSQTGAWASDQSRKIPDRRTLELKVSNVEDRFNEEDIPLPPYWGGYILEPHRIEFWQGRADRLHDRLFYTKTDGDWVIMRLQP